MPFIVICTQYNTYQQGVWYH